MARILKYFLFTLTIYFCQFNLLAQQYKIDSLLTILKTYKEDTNNVNLLHKLCLEFQKVGDNNSALYYEQQTLSLSQKIKWKIGEAKSYNSIGAIYWLKGNYPEALKNYFSSLKIREAIGDKCGVAISFNNIGLIYYSQNNYSEALKNLLISLKIFESIDDKNGISESYMGIGNIYNDQGNYPAALKNYFASLKINEEIGNKIGVAEDFINIGILYKRQGNYQEGLKNYFASLKIGETIGDKKTIIFSYNEIGDVLTKQKKYNEAKEYLLKASNLSNEIKEKDILRDTYCYLTKLDSAMRDFKGAYENHKLYILYRDSIDNEEIRKKTIQTQMTYDFEKKEAVSTAEHKKELENQEALAEEKSRKQKAVIGFVGFGLLLVLVFAGFIFRSLRVTRKQKVLIEEQKEIVEHQKHIVEEHQKEIVDSITYAKRIQYTLLANKKLLDDNLSSPWGGAEGGGGYFVLFKPKDIVSGDFYWATKKTDSRQSTEGKEEKTERFYIAACDSTGHGVPGAFMSLLNISFLNEAVNEKNILEPHEILNHVRKRLIENMDGGQDGMDCILLCIESSPLSFGEGAGVRCTYAAANNSPTIIKNGKLISLEADKMPVGKGEKGESFTLRHIEIEKGDSLYLYTDGYADQFGGPKGKKFKYKQLEELLVSIADKPCKEQSEILKLRFEEWKGNLEQVDDVLLIGIRA